MTTAKSILRVRADALRNVAQRRNQTLHDLARTLGISERHFYRVLNGEVVPSPQTRANMCRLLRLRFDELFELGQP